MKKLLVVMLVVMLFLLVGCGDDENTTTQDVFKDSGNFTVEVIEKIDDQFYDNGFVVKKTSNYAVGGIWVMVAFDIEYEVGDIATVKWFGNDYCVPLLEYIDQDIDGYTFGYTDYGIGWYKEGIK